MNSQKNQQWVQSRILEALYLQGSWGSLSGLGPLLSSLKITRRTLGRHVARMLEDGVLEQRGSGRATEYRQNPISAWFSVPPHQRPAAPYDPTRLMDYMPNKTRWLSELQHERLRTAQPPRIQAGSYPLAVAEKLMVDLSYASSHLEGNTYNYLDTETLVRYGQAAKGKDADETTMILNHKSAVSYLVEVAQSSDTVSGRTIKELHSLLSQGLIDPREMGALRQRRITIGGSSYVPLDIPSQLEEQFKVLVDKAIQINDPFEQSLFWMVQIAYLQPFIDINKRTGRLACNVPLLRANIAPLSFMNMDKGLYVKGLLEFYELGATTTIANAFERAYVASAHRYEAHISKDPETAGLDRLYKQELAEIVRSYVNVVANDDPDVWEDVVAACLGHVSDNGIKGAIDRRACDLLDGLNEANRIVYGINFDQYDLFSRRQKKIVVADRKPPKP